MLERYRDLLKGDLDLECEIEREREREGDRESG